MTLTDTGPLVALLNRNDSNHLVCLNAIKSFSFGPLLTTWPCFTEAMYLMGQLPVIAGHFLESSGPLMHKVGGYTAQAALWRLRASDRLLLHQTSDQEEMRMASLMAKYRDLPMDLADASLVVAASTNFIRRVFTLDRDFLVYRSEDGSAFELIPQC